MPILTYLAGSPSALSELAGQLEGAFAAAADDLVSSLISRRRSAEDHWEGGAGDAAVNRLSDLVDGTEQLRTAAQGIGAAVETYSAGLRSAQSAMEDARDIARSGGLTVTDRLIEGPPPAPDSSWETTGLVQLTPAQEPHFEAWNEKMVAWNSAVDKADGAIEDFGEVCQRLVEDLGEQSGTLAAIGDKLSEIVPGGLDTLGRVLDGAAGRMDAAATRAGFFASISPEQSKILYQNLFLQMDTLDDANLLRSLSGAAKTGGVAVDTLSVGLSAIERDQMGQSTNQILLAEGGGWVAGAVATGGTWMLLGGGAGSSVGPVGTVVVGGVALTAGLVVGGLTRDAVDDWYDDREFEELIRNAQSVDVASD